MKKLLLVISTFAFVLGVYAQSGRNRPAETPTPTATPRAHIVYVPTQNLPDSDKPKPSPTPATAQKSKGTDEGDGDIIRVSSALVPIPVSVTNAGGKSVTNLKLQDFQLEIDGQQAEISDISLSQSPVRLALLFDNSSSVRQAREFEKNAAIRFFRQVIRPDRDQAALFAVASITRLEQPLTRNVSQVISAIQNFPPPEGATALLDGIIKASDYLQKVEGRRVIVIVSDGEDTLSDSTFEQSIKAAQAANCQIYVVKTTDFENYKESGVRGGNANIRSLTAERRMQDLANQTGGAVYSPIDEDELNAAFTRISAELSDQYILSYYPEEAAQTGAFRAIALKVNSRENLTVRTRKGYYPSRK